MKRCEREWDAATAAGVQKLVKELCGHCLCENGQRCPLFSYAPRGGHGEAEEAIPQVA